MQLAPVYHVRLVNVWYRCSVTLICLLMVYSTMIARRVTVYIWEIDDILTCVELRFRKIYQTYDCRVDCKTLRGHWHVQDVNSSYFESSVTCGVAGVHWLC